MCRVNLLHDSTSIVDSPNRRTVLRGGLALGVGVVAVSAIAGCDSGPTQAQITAEALLPLAQAADAEFTAARTLAPQTPEYTAALAVIADQREQQARELREEITRLDMDIADRLNGPNGGGTGDDGTGANTTDDTSPTPTPAPITTVDELRDALGRSQRAAHEAAVTLHGYSAGLTGAIAASLTTMTDIQLR